MTPPAAADSHEVSLTITRDPSLVRTVRLVAASLARRAGLDAAAVEEVRLAVGETCAVMIGTAEDDAVPSAEGDQVTVTLKVGDGLVAEISGPPARPAGDPPEELAELATDRWILLRGLGDDVEVDEQDSSTQVRLPWPA